MELTRVRRLGKIVLRGFAKAFVLDSEPGQQFTLRQETIDHPPFPKALRRGQRQGRDRMLAGQKNARCKPASPGVVSGYFDDRRCRSSLRLDQPASSANGKAGRVVVGMSAFVSMNEDCFSGFHSQ